MLQFLGSLGAIVLVDLALSGDNALIIGAAAAGLPPRQRTLAIVGGGGAAIALRVLFAVAATLLLEVPLLEAIGGAILVVIAVRLLLGSSAHAPAPRAFSDELVAPVAPRKPTATLGAAMVTILIADVTMSLDNILAVGGLARGDLLALSIGLLLSIAILLVGSAIVAGLIGRLPWLLDLAAIVLGWTAGSMLYHDKIAGAYLTGVPAGGYVFPAIGALIVLLIDLGLRWRASRSHTGDSNDPAHTPAKPAESR